MATTLTKTGITFPGLRLSVVLDPDGVTLHYFLAVGYDVQTAQGEVIHRDAQTEIIGALLTGVTNLFTAVTTIIKTKEGL